MIIVLAMLSVLFAPFIRITEAAETEQIIKNLEIVQKSDEYFPGESIYIKGDWSIPDDTPGNQYKAGDTFSMTIPQGLEAGFSSVNLGGLATGKIVGDKLVFTFTDEIEGLANRKGGFQLRFEVKSPDEEGKSEVDIGSKDENGNVLITDKITVNKPEQGEVGPSDESFAKGKMSQKMDGLEWYVRINHNNSITGNQIKFEDRLGPDHRLKEGTIVVQEHITGPQDVTDITDRVEIVIDSDKKGFTIPKLELGNAPGGHKHYTIYYETQYTGDETEGKVQLENTAKVISEDQGVLYPDHSKDEGMVEGEFDLGVAGWGQGNKWVKFKMKKVDSVTKEPLAGAKFKLSHKIDENFTPIEFTTDKNGEYEYDGHINNGLYVLEELEAPKGYEKMEPQDLRIFWDPDGGDHQVFEFEVENTLEPISIKGEKEWFDENNEPIESQEDIAVSLYANGEKVRQQILPKGETAFEFKNLPQKDEDGKTIKYTVKEVEVAGYTTSIAGNAALGFIITNTKDIVDPEPERTEVSVEKTWIGEKQDQVTVHLLADGKQVDTVELNEDNNWKHTFTDLAVVNDAGSVIEYTVEEAEVAGYTTSIAGNAALGFTITNTKDTVDPEPELTEVSVEKEWIGEVGDSVTVNLLADGKQVDTVDLNEGNNWKHSFTDLAVVNDAGSVIKYTVEEVEVAGYTTSIAGNAALGFIITNTKDMVDPEPELTEVYVEKTWIGEKQDQVTVHLLADGKQVNTVDLNEGNNWKHSFTDLAVVNDAGSVIKYTVEEVEV
ncbi:MAG: Cna B-type domain-containing protein, partial [Tetragenococcus koreensis]|nr:Cna B-type domain-containing protein [Tetragenococcus koreensis]